MTLVRSVRILAAMGVVTLGLGAGSHAATITGTAGVASIGSIGTDSGNLFTATEFTFSNLISTLDLSGDFADHVAGNEFLNGATFNLANVGLFSFGNATFGTFTGTSFQELTPNSNTRTFYVLGTFDPGSLFPGSIQDAGPASFVFSITANSVGYSSSGVLASPPTALVPEPASLAMVGMGSLAGLGLLARRRIARA